MKKFMTLAAMFAAVMVSFSSCNKEPQGTTNENCEVCGENPCVCEEPTDEYVAPITVDGNSADWDALDATKVAVATCAPEANWTAMKSVKVYADGNFMYVLMEVNADEIVGDCPIDIYLNTDMDESEVNNNFLGESTLDYLLEGAYYAESAEGAGDHAVVDFNPGFFAYGGTVEEFKWAFDAILEGGFTVGAGTVAKYEFAIDMLKLADEASVEWGDAFGFGITVSQDWEPVGLLPNANATEENGKGSANFMTVTINK